MVGSLALNELNKLKADVMRKYDKKEITEEEYNIVMLEVTNLIKEQVGMILKKNSPEELDKKIVQMEEVKMAKEEKVVAPIPVKVKEPKEKKVKEPKVKKISRQEIILEVLQMKSINSVDKAVAKVLEKRPEDVPKEKDVKVHINWTLSQLKAKERVKFLNYTFNPETFDVVKKE